MMFFETSAKNGDNINTIFKESVEYIKNNIENGIYDLNDDSCGVKSCNTTRELNFDELDIDVTTMAGRSKNKKKCC